MKPKLSGRMWVALAIHVLAVLFAPHARSATHYEGYYMYRGDNPYDKSPGWAEDAQGITHDAANWFITQKEALWKIPVTNDLSFTAIGQAGVINVGFGNLPGYDHFGDPDYYETHGVGYVLVPIESKDWVNPPNGLAIFRASDLSYVAHNTFPAQTGASWCAVDPQGCIYSSEFDDVVAINKYSLDWQTLLNPTPSFTLSKVGSVALYNEFGMPMTGGLDRVQGGVISPSGEMLYLSLGYDDCQPTDGIHVFDISTAATGHRVQRSENGSGHFNFEFSCGGLSAEEVEGLTIWELENPDSEEPCRPCESQLHVLLLDQDLTGRDNVFLKHYSRRIYVKGDDTGDDEPTGEPHKPFKTMNSANGFAWDGAELFIASGSYPEALTITKRLLLTPKGGPITIGR